MARSVSDIQASITASFVSNMATIGIAVDTTTWSATSLIRLLIYIFSVAANILETIFDQQQTDVNTALSEESAHTLKWYRNKAIAYQYGFPLMPDTDQFDNTGYTADQIAASQVVKYAAAIKQTDQNGHSYIRMKTAGFDGTDLVQESTDVVAGLQEYFDNDAADAGCDVLVESNPPDSTVQTWDIYYDPLILTSTGARKDGTDADPVGTSIRSFVGSLTFNGIYVKEYAQDTVEAVPGVVIAAPRIIQATYGSLPYQTIDEMYTPDAGWMRFIQPTDLTLNFIAQSALK